MDNDLKAGSNLEKILKAGHFAFTGELGPPRGGNVEEVRHKAAPLKGMVGTGRPAPPGMNSPTSQGWRRGKTSI